jgi:hypothetical protein
MKTRSIRATTRRWQLAAIVGGLALVGNESRAQAALPVATIGAIIQFYQKAYQVLGLVQSIFGDSGPSIAAQLQTVEANILNELRTQRNQAWRATAQSAFDKFRILAARSVSNPDNPALRDEASSLATTAIEQLAIIVQDGTDVESSYQLAPTFDSLVVTQTGLTRMLDEMFPDTPPPWAEYHVYLWRGITTDYRLIGAQFFQCWPGFDPGTGNYTVSLPSELTRSYRDSQLWTKKIANKNVSLGTFQLCGAARGQCFCGVASKDCNPGTKTCVRLVGCSPCTPLSCNNFLFPLSDSLLKASQAVDPTWNADGVVKTTRAAMLGIISVGGGEDPGSDADVDLPHMGMLVDPWVDEPRCGPNGPWAYPTMP